MDAVVGARPDPPVPVETEAVEQPARAFGEDLAAGYVLSVFRNGEAADVARSVLLCVAPVSAT